MKAMTSTLARRLTFVVLSSLLLGFLSSFVFSTSLPIRAVLAGSIGMLSIGTVWAGATHVRAEVSQHEYANALVTALLFTGAVLVCAVAGAKAVLLIFGSGRTDHWVGSSVSWGLVVLLFAVWLATIDEALKAFKKNRQNKDLAKVVGGCIVATVITVAIAYADLTLWRLAVR